MKQRAWPVDVHKVISRSDELCRMDADCVEHGYVRTGARAWLCQDHTMTLRLVWRRRDAAGATITFVMRGLQP